MVLEGAADIAWVVPGQTPYRFPDNQVLELPGLFHDVREGTLIYMRLIAANALRGYQDFFVIGAYTSAPSIIHSRKPIASLAGLKSQKIRANNPMEAEALERLGAIPTVMPASQLADALAHGAIDAVYHEPGRLVSVWHRALGGQPLSPRHRRRSACGADEPQEIRQPAGSGAGAHPQIQRRARGGIWIKSFGASEQRALDKIKSDPAHKAVEPSPADRAAAQHVYKSLMDAWAAKSARNRELLKTIEADLAAIRTTNR